MIWLGCAAAFALAPNDEMRVQLRGGDEVVGAVHTADADVLVLSGDNQLTEIPLALVETAWIEDREVDRDALGQELEAYVEWDLARRELGPALRTPAPPFVATASILWPGSGHLMLGDPKGFVGYAVVDAALIGAGVWFAVGEGNAAPLLPLAAIDAGVRVYAAADATRTARRRRKALTLGPVEGGGVSVGFVSDW
ncbi:MAG: hypothetical protein GY913_08710 [Proteobacteria bacterium]|nr:hypothetical protein [Pseudomonadota bacterium]MCP4916992.1 hypothetical protein [Pseudomonadota bacterium]